MTNTIDHWKNTASEIRDALPELKQTAADVAETVKANPIPYSIAGAGLAWALASSRRSEPARPTVGEQVGDAAAAVKRSAAEAVQHAKERASAALEGAKHTAGEAVDRVRDAAGRPADETGALRRFVEGHPLATGASALALGVLAGVLLPRSRHEDRWFGPASDEIAGEVKATGNEALEAARDALANADEAVRNALDDARRSTRKAMAGATA